MNLTDQQYNFLKNLEEEGIYGTQTISYLKDGFDMTDQQAAKVLLQYIKLPKLNQAGQATMDRYANVTGHDIVIAIIALVGVCWALTIIL